MAITDSELKCIWHRLLCIDVDQIRVKVLASLLQRPHSDGIGFQMMMLTFIGAFQSRAPSQQAQTRFSLTFIIQFCSYTHKPSFNTLQPLLINRMAYSIDVLQYYSMYRFLITVLVLSVVTSTDTINGGVTLSSNLTLATNVTYTFQIWPNIVIYSGSTLQIQFSSMYSINSSNLGNCKATISTSVPLATADCYASNDSSIFFVNFDTLFSSTSTINEINLQFTINNPIGSGSENVDIYISNTTGALAHARILIGYDSNSLSSCSIVSSSDVVGASSTLTMQFVPTVPISSGSTMTIRFSPWGCTSYTNFVATPACTAVTNAGASMSCTNSSSGNLPKAVTSQLITISNMFPNAIAAGTTVALNISNLRNSPSTEPYGPYTFTISFGGKVSQTTTNIYLTVGTPGALTLTIGNLTTNRSISAVNPNVRISIRTTNGFPSSGYVRVTFPTNMVAYVGTNTGFSNSTMISLTGMQATNVTVGGTIGAIVSYTVTYPTSIRPANLVFTTVTNSSGVVYVIDTATRAVTATAGVITTAAVAIANNSVNVPSTCTVTFTTVNNLVAGSVVIVQFPNTLTLQGTTCSSTGATGTCAASGTAATLTLTSTLNNASSVTITVPNVKNPSSAITTSSLSINTYYDSGLDSGVDSISTGLTLTSVANLLTVASVTPTLKQVGATTSYTFSITLNDPITIGGYFDLKFPAEVSFSAANTLLTILSSSMEATCTISPSGTTIRFNNCFASANRSTSSPLSFSLSSISNPSSFQPSSSFQIFTYDSSGNAINYQNSSLSTLSVTMDTNAALSATITVANNTVHQTTTYTFSIVFTVAHISGDQLVLTFPSEIVPPGTPSCTALTGFTSVGCTTFSQTVTVTMGFTTFPVDYKASFSIGGVQNYDVTATVAFAFQTQTAGLYKMEYLASATVSFVADTLTSVGVNNDENVALLSASNISLTITSPFTLRNTLSSASTSVVITIPSGFTIGAACTSSSGSCSATSSTEYTVSGPGLTLSNLVVVLNSLTLPYFSPTSSSFSVSYFYSSSLIASKTSGIVVTVYCTSPCKQCSSSKTSCLSCLPAPNTLISYDSDSKTCVQTCPTGKYNDANNFCQKCVSPCATCTTNTSCLSCTTGTWLSGTSCVTVCPDKSYNDSSGLCTACVGPCDKCTTVSACITCLTGYLSGTSCVPANNCPAGTYPEASNLTCNNCTSPCNACSVVGTNCTSCITSYLYYSNQCVQNCPAGMYQSSTFCFNCVSPCGNCTSATSCLSCPTAGDFLSGTTCVTTCPAGTFADTSTKKCTTCTDPCSTCSVSAVNCTTCSSTYYLYSNKCYLTCPTKTYSSGTNCVDCAPPCDTCSSANICLSCLTDFLSNGSCVTTCPTGTYPNVNTCTTCPVNCTACSSSTSCSSCATNYIFYNNNCLTTCPTGLYSNGTSCLPCSSTCTSCQGSSGNCTGCTSPQILYNNTCYSTCPTGTYLSSATCVACNSSCTSCTSATSCDTCSSTFFLLNNTCYSICPDGYYGSGTTCQTCTSPCKTCSGSASNCLSCSVGFYYGGYCITTCPDSTGPYNGTCVPCGNCIKCIDAFSCQTCQAGYYTYANKCYAACPPQAPIAQINMTCVVCESTCLTCSMFTYNCTSCFNGKYLFRYQCVETCPDGMIGQASTGTCIQPIIGRIVFFPGTLFAVAFICVFLYAKWAVKQTEFFTAATAIFGLAEFIAWNILTYVLVYDYELSSTNKQAFFVFGLIVCISCLLTSIAWVLKVWFTYCKDNKGFELWQEKAAPGSKIAKYIALTFSSFMFRFYRILYSRLFGKQWVNSFYSEGPKFLHFTRTCTYLSVCLNSIPMVAAAGALVYLKRIKDQTYYNCIDVAVVSAISSIFAIINCQVPADFFEESREQLGISADYENVMSEDTSSVNQEKIRRRNNRDRDPNKKFRNSWEEWIYQNRRRVKTACDSKADAEKLFRGIKFADPNKFGHLNVLEDPPEEKEKSLPEYDELFKLGEQGDNAKDFKEALKEKRRKILEDKDQVVLDDEEERERERIEQELREKIRREDQERLKKVQQQLQRQKQQERRKEAERIRKQKEEDDRRRREEEDALEQVDITFQDKVFISKELDKNSPKKKQDSPLDRLKKFKSAQQRSIDDKQMKKLEELAAINGLDKQFLKKVLGKQKSYNPQLLKNILGKYSHFQKDLAQKIFSPDNDPEVLQALFGKDSTLDPQKLKEFFYQGNMDEVLFDRIFKKQGGLQSPQLAKQIFERNSKLSPEFVGNLLGRQSPANPEKLKQLFKAQNMPDMKHLKKLVGENAQNTSVINNLLGDQSKLDMSNVKRMTEGLKQQTLEDIFKTNQEKGERIVEKLVNDPAVDMKALGKILRNSEALQTVNRLLESGDNTAIQNLKRLIKQSPNLDQALLDEFLSKPDLVAKLFGSCNIDPALMNKLLGKDSKCDLNTFQNVVMKTNSQNLKQMFEFSPQTKNLDFDGIATIFDKDKKTDPELIVKLFQNPQLFKDLYTKGNNDPTILKKLFQKGREFNPEFVQKLYGKDKNPFMAANYDFELSKDRNAHEDDFHSMRGQGSSHRLAQQVNMSRTEGINFLKPKNFVNVHNIVQLGSQQNLLEQDGNDPEGSDAEKDDDGEEVVGRRRKKKLPKIKPKKQTDIRLDAEAIYLQRLEAPAEKKIKEIRKKKKKQNKKGIMDEDNDEYDLDF